MSVVTGAAAFWPEAASLVEGDGGSVAGADFEGDVAGVISSGPGEDRAEEGGAEALAAGDRVDGDGVELA